MVKKHPAGVPFVFETRIKVEDAVSKEEKSRLEAGLNEQLDDSIRSRRVDKVLWAVIKDPPKLDTSQISKSIQSMHYYLNAQGYFQDSIGYLTSVKKVEDQLRGTIQFYVWPRQATKIDSLAYVLQNDSLQKVTDENLENAFVKKGALFAQAPISAEMDRLVELYRNNGYLRFSRGLLFGLWDTLDVSLLEPTLDPLEQAAQLERLKNRRLNPTADLEIRTRPIEDSAAIRKYYVGNFVVYPNSSDTSGSNRKETLLNNITVVQTRNTFKPKIFPQNIYLKKGDPYDQRRYIRTLNRFNNIGSWRMVDIAQLPRDNQDTVDFAIRLLPAKKYNFTTNVEGSFSQSVLSGNFVGLGFSLGLQNRNFARAANLMSTNVNYLIELGQLTAGDIIQTQQFSATNTISYPRFIFPGMQGFKNNFRGNFRSLFTLSAASTERRYLFNLTSLSSAWGYEFGWRGRDYSSNNRTFNLSIKIPNIEYSYLIRRDSLDRMIARNPSIKNLFSDGLITSSIMKFIMPWGNIAGHSTNVIRANFEESGLLTGMIRNSFLDQHLYRFVKLDVEYAKLYQWAKTALVLRGFAGAGYELESTANPEKRAQMPFFKQYYSGGPNSMRAWQLRRLGPGSTIKSFEGEYSFPDRFGDMQLEANIEYRMPLFKMGGIPINGAVFTDIGNVWLLKKDAGLPDEIFKLGRLGTDLAVGSGAGVRVDLGFFVIRLDYAYKVKDPSPAPESLSYRNRFFAYPFIKGSQLQIGIGYPFIF
ncbi:BamA/TamA family outer membrane protein [Niabella drilacis]|uniref:BamA/TamA family outer membrane protein n=1 Tax=Niabella drilacis (strain DSM 25811 / CCM 8410 / CCUG 62505 / LMG 26954 / E90) TaxID=1285928 RepID=UPI001FDF3339|nr:BamA/TamA family outer membrane protein [Niabella drilacis]